MAVEKATTIDVGYCASWDPVTHTAVAPMPERLARARDAAGEPYAVLLTHHQHPKALFHVDWSQGYLGLFLFDAQGRRTREYDYRELEEGRLHLREYREWRLSSDDEAEFPDHGWCFTLTIEPDGRCRPVLEDGGSLHTSLTVPPEHRSLPRADFGDWTAYADTRVLDLDSPAVLVPARYEGDDTASPATVPVWTVPAPLRPGPIEALFTSGSRLAGDGGVAVITEPRPAGRLRLPTGSVIAADPGTIDKHDEPFTVTVAPGEYPVLIADMHWEEGWSETPAVMLRILDKPTATWELALRPGQDARLLGEGEFYGFGVDTGTGAFLDASGRDTLAEIADQRMQTDLFNDADSSHAEISDPGTGTNLIAYLSGRGDGSYPVWIGRDSDGDVTCFVADMLILHRATPLEPTAPSTAVYVQPPPAAVTGARSQAPFGRPGAIADFIAAQIDDIVAFHARLRERSC